MRRLSREERELWRQLRRSVRPLRTTPVEADDVSSPSPAAAASAPVQTAAAPAALKPARSQPPPLTRLEERARRRLLRGISGIDARIDLHGMVQERAFTALLGFLRRSQAQGARLVLVITGKGRQSDAGHGVLRRVVPAWLARPDFRDVVLGFEEAGTRHGGGGAIYVRLRRRRDAKESP